MKRPSALITACWLASSAVTFRQGVDPDIAQVQVQNRVQRALPRLPQDVQRLGITTTKTSPDVLMVVHMLSPNGRYDPLFVSNYALLQVRDELARLPGVGDVAVWGAGEYSMRVWLDPAKVASRRLTASDVVAAMREQNVEVAAGSIGQSPNASSAFQVAIDAKGRLQTEDEFGALADELLHVASASGAGSSGRTEMTHTVCSGSGDVTN